MPVGDTMEQSRQRHTHHPTYYNLRSSLKQILTKKLHDAELEAVLRFEASYDIESTLKANVLDRCCLHVPSPSSVDYPVHRYRGFV